jgi:hypothetical protein
MALVGKPGTEDIYEIPDTEVEKARGKGYKQYFDVTKDDKNTFTIAEDELEKAKSKGYRIFGQPVQPPPAKPAEEPSWISRAAESAVETAKGLPSGLYELGKEAVTKPVEAAGAALTGTAKTLGLGAATGALRGGYEAGKALLTGEEVQPAFKRGYEAEVSGLEERAKQAKQTAPAAYAAGPYVAAGLATGGAGLPAALAAETAVGAAQQLAETGKVDTAGLAGQTVAGGVAMGAPAAARAGLKGVEKVAEAVPAAMKKAAIESAPEILRPAAAKMAGSPQALEQYRMAEYELKKPGGLEEQWKQQKSLLEDATKELKKTQSEDAANALSEAINKGLERQRQRANALYDEALGSMTDQLDINKSEVGSLAKVYSEFDPMTKGYAKKTFDAIQQIASDQQAALPGGYTTGQEFKNLVKLDQSLNADISKIYNTQRMSGGSTPVAQDALARLEGLKQEVAQRINSRELNLPKDIINKYNEAKSVYRDYSKVREDFDSAGALAKQNVMGKKKIRATAEKAYKTLAPKVEDYSRTADIVEALQRLPGEEAGTPAMTPEQFTQLKQQAKGRVTEEQLPITPEQASLKETVEAKQAQAAEYAELSKPRETFTPGKIGLIQKAVEKVPVVKEFVGGSPVTKISRAQAVEQAFKIPGLSFAVKVLENSNKPITSAIIRSLARQHQVDPNELESVLAQQRAP